MVVPDERIEALRREYPGHPYKKWQGAHWRLVSLVELGVSSPDGRIARAVDQVLTWLLNPRRKTPRVDGRYRQCASKDGNALLVCCRLGLHADPRVKELAARLVAWQWPDGGWNCDPRPDVTHSSFHESLAPLRGLAAYGGFRQAVVRAAEFFLRHRMFRSESSGTVINAEWLSLHWPAYWHYDTLQGLRAIAEAGLIGDARVRDAMDQLQAQRGPDGRWRASGRRYWRLSGDATIDLIDWGDAVDVLTEQADQVLRAAARYR
jgi:hypothetical protein